MKLQQPGLRHRSFPLLRHPRVRPSHQHKSCGSLRWERGDEGRVTRGPAASQRGPGSGGREGKRETGEANKKKKKPFSGDGGYGSCGL